MASSRKRGTCACGNPTSRTGRTVCSKCKPFGRPGDRASARSSTVVRGNEATVTKQTARRVRTLAELVDVCEIDLKEWRVETWSCGAYEGQSKDNDTSKVTVTPMFTVRAVLRRKVEALAARAEVESIFRAAAKRMRPLPFVRRPSSKSGHMLEIAIPDLHLGKLAWSKETGYANYDMKIARALFKQALETLVARTSHYTFDKIVFPVGNDFFHSDTKAGTTTSGTQLDNDGRFQKMYETGREMIVEAIERLRLLAPVEVVMVPGNHDALSNFSLGDSLACWFRNTSDVKVDNSPTQRKYIQHGACLLMWTHGNLGKRTNYPLLAATERPAMWASSRHREIHCGHRHELRVDELMGVRVRTFSALSGVDAWHSENHFVGNARAADGLVWHKNDGLILQATYTVPEAA